MPSEPDPSTTQGSDGTVAHDMRAADIANGEHPDAADHEPTPPRPATRATSDTDHPTGEQQAAINRDDDPPA